MDPQHDNEIVLRGTAAAPGIAVGPASTTVTTTDIHLPQRIGAALTSTFQGTLDVQYGHQEYSVRVHWRR